jgi:nicotinamidase-related amidase
VPDHSREFGLLVAFIRMIMELAFFNRAAPFIHRIESFETYPNEIVFKRSGQSCFSGEALTAPLNQSGGGIVRAGFAAEAACLSTFIDLSQRNPKAEVTSRCDASASHGLDDMSADETHRAVSKISGLYAEVFETTEFIASITS